MKRYHSLNWFQRALPLKGKKKLSSSRAVIKISRAVETRASVFSIHARATIYDLIQAIKVNQKDHGAFLCKYLYQIAIIA